MALTWFQLASVPNGTRVRFASEWDIFPMTKVPVGTLATVTDNGLNEMWCQFAVVTDNIDVRESLKEWDGQVILCPDLNPESDDGVVANEWHSESPLELV